MKSKQLFITVFAFFVFFVSACKDDEITQEQKDNQHVNAWIFNNMDLYYYWEDKMPSAAAVDDKINPESYFQGLLYNYGKIDGDRFSWIQGSYVDLINSLSGVSRDIGFQYQPLYINEQQTKVGFYILYTKSNTDAENKGIQRGEFIVKVDGVDIDKNNYASIISSGKSSYKLTVLDATMESIREVMVNMMESYKEDPIYYTKIYERNGRKIGYVMYNFFSPDNGEGNYKYDIRLASKFAEFKQAGVTDLVLDLRYNNGGRISSAINLASALVPNRKTTDIFCYNEYNKGLQEYLLQTEGKDFFNDYFVDKINISTSSQYPIPTLGINQLYVIATDYSASASELVINGLKPYMPVVLIGKTTIGKNVGSSTFYDDKDPRNKWGIQPIILKTYNSKGESNYTAGFEPDYYANEFATALMPIGHEDEILLATAIDKIAGTNRAASIIKSKQSKQFTIIPGSSSFENKPGAFQMFIDDNKIKDIRLN